MDKPKGIDYTKRVEQPNNPLHGVRLDTILTYLVEAYGWEQMGKEIRIKCFTTNPTMKSSLKFLRRTDWARKKVEELYLRTIDNE